MNMFFIYIFEHVLYVFITCFLYIIFSAPSLTKNHFCTTERADIYRRYKQFSIFQKIGILLAK